MILFFFQVLFPIVALPQNPENAEKCYDTPNVCKEFVSGHFTATIQVEGKSFDREKSKSRIQSFIIANLFDFDHLPLN